MEGYVQGALRKELHIAPFVEHLKTTTLEKSYWKRLLILQKKRLSIAFFSNFCW